MNEYIELLIGIPIEDITEINRSNCGSTGYFSFMYKGAYISFYIDGLSWKEHGKPDYPLNDYSLSLDANNVLDIKGPPPAELVNFANGLTDIYEEEERFKKEEIQRVSRLKFRSLFGPLLIEEK